MDILGQTSVQSILFFILYGVTGAVPLLAALYLLLRRGNAFAPDITPPVRLRRWAAAFFIMAVLGHVWWMLFYVYSRDLRFLDAVPPSPGYVAVVVLDCVSLLTTLAGTLLSMLQDRRRSVWPAFVAMVPFLVLGGVLIVYPSQQILLVAIAYVLLLYVLFTIYMVLAVRRYGRWLNDNYADLENKKVWLSQVVTLACLLLFMLYTLVEIDATLLMFLLHFTELALFGLLLWRVETLPQLEAAPADEKYIPQAQESPVGAAPAESTFVPDTMPIMPIMPMQQEQPEQQPSANPVSIDLAQIEQLLKEHCVDTRLYLQHNLTLQQLAQAVGTNRYYLSQYFSRQGITYNIYINNLRINHFINRYQELAAAGQPIVAQQLSSESGFRSYSTFARAFVLRTGQSVTAWMRDSGGVIL
ncbi:MAG: helix-turn-helix transcriptional regulator [Bacteroidaceae bacterium]|nr:helix-turn-helix transcriptional regulator [Bacteroidaceae bacterium]